MDTYTFGTGAMYGTDSDGNVIEFGTLQNITFSPSFDVKELYGSKSFPVSVARGKGKIECKATWAAINAQNFNLFANGTVSSGRTRISEEIYGTIPSATPYTVVIETVENSGTFSELLSVYDVSGSDPVLMTETATTPASGTYTFDSSTKTLTFAAADEGKSIKYRYSYSLTTGNTIAVINPFMGDSPYFSVDLQTAPLNSNVFSLHLFKCISTKLDFSFKNEDYTTPDFTFSAFQDTAGRVYQAYMD